MIIFSESSPTFHLASLLVVHWAIHFKVVNHRAFFFYSVTLCSPLNCQHTDILSPQVLYSWKLKEYECLLNFGFFNRQKIASLLKTVNLLGGFANFPHHPWTTDPRLKVNKNKAHTFHVMKKHILKLNKAELWLHVNISQRIPPSRIQLSFKVCKTILNGRKVFPHLKGKQVLCQHANFPVINHRSVVEVSSVFVARLAQVFIGGDLE